MPFNISDNDLSGLLLVPVITLPLLPLSNRASAASRSILFSCLTIISGAFNRDESKDIIVNTLANFYIEGLGIKCVKEEPWVSVAETNEFVIAAVKADEINLAKNIFLESLNISDEDNLPYMGWQYVENIFWPDEKPTWTAAAVILAADSLYKFTDGSNLFIDMQTKNL